MRVYFRELNNCIVVANLIIILSVTMQQLVTQFRTALTGSVECSQSN